MMKIRASGTVAWKRTFGTSGNEHILRIVETRDKGFMILADADHDPNLNDIVVAKFSPAGLMIWRKVISGGAFDNPSDLALTSDNGAVVAFSFEQYGGMHSAVVRLGADGMVQWSRIFGASGNFGDASIVEAAGGGYYMSQSFTPAGARISRIMLSRLNISGVPLWARTYQTPNASLSGSIIRIGGGNTLALSGNSVSPGGQTQGLLIGFDAAGKILWRKRVKPDNRPVVLAGARFSESDHSIVTAGCAGNPLSSNVEGLLLKIRSNGAFQGVCPKLPTFPLSTAAFNLTSAPLIVQEIPVPFLSGQAGFQVISLSALPTIACSTD
jgi:hypothetical protein